MNKLTRLFIFVKRYPNVTPEQLRTYADTICIICREEMNADNQVKKLPCDHIFHKNCLRSWFQRQQTCPTCRTSILRYTPPPATQAAQQQQQAAAAGGGAVPAAPQAAAAQAPPAAAVGQVPPTPVANDTNLTRIPSFNAIPSQTSAANSFTNGQSPIGLPNIMPPFMFPPPPLPELNLSELSDEELRSLEGDERHNLEARVHCLRNINVLLNGAFVHIQQYMNMTMASSHLDNLNGNRNVKIENDLKFINVKKTGTTSATATAAAAASNDNNNINTADNACASNNLTNFDLGSDEDDVNSIRRRRLNHFKSQEQL